MDLDIDGVFFSAFHLPFRSFSTLVVIDIDLVLYCAGYFCLYIGHICLVFFLSALTVQGVLFLSVRFRHFGSVQGVLLLLVRFRINQEIQLILILISHFLFFYLK